MVSVNDLGIVEALKNYGLLKYFKLSRMRQQSELFGGLGAGDIDKRPSLDIISSNSGGVPFASCTGVSVIYF